MSASASSSDPARPASFARIAAAAIGIPRDCDRAHVRDRPESSGVTAVSLYLLAVVLAAAIAGCVERGASPRPCRSLASSSSSPPRGSRSGSRPSRTSWPPGSPAGGARRRVPGGPGPGRAGADGAARARCAPPRVPGHEAALGRAAPARSRRLRSSAAWSHSTSRSVRSTCDLDEMQIHARAARPSASARPRARPRSYRSDRRSATRRSGPFARCAAPPPAASLRASERFWRRRRNRRRSPSSGLGWTSRYAGRSSMPRPTNSGPLCSRA